MDLEAISMRGYSVFPKAVALLESHHQIVSCHIQETRWAGSYPSAKKQSVYSTSQVGWADQLFGPVGSVFAKAPGDQGSIPGRIISKTLKMVLVTSLFSAQQYKVRIKSKVEQSRERSSALPYTAV